MRQQEGKKGKRNDSSDDNKGIMKRSNDTNKTLTSKYTRRAEEETIKKKKTRL